METCILLGDLCKVRAEALVNAAGTSLRMGGGVAGALKSAGGKEIEEEALESAPAELGSVVATTTGKLNAKYVFHAAAQPHYGDFRATEESVWNATFNALKKAEELRVKSIAFPALGCGIAGLEIEKGAKAMLGAVREFEGHAECLESVKIALYSEKDFEAFKKEFVGRIPSRKECMELLAEKGVPENIVRHSMAVRDFALELARDLKNQGKSVCLELAEAGALLHDIDKIETLEGKEPHGEPGRRFLRKKGFFGAAEIVKKHVLEKIDLLCLLEEKIVYYADKRVIGERVVPLGKRIEFIKEKYGSKNRKTMRGIIEREPLLFGLEKELLGKN